MIPDIDRKDHRLLFNRPRREYPPLIWQRKPWKRLLRDFPTLEHDHAPEGIRCYIDGEDYPFDPTLLRTTHADRQGHEFDFCGAPHVGKSVIRTAIRDSLDALHVPYVSRGEPVYDSMRSFGENSDETNYRILRDFARMFSNRADNERGLFTQFPQRLFLYENALLHPYLFASALKKLDATNGSQPERIAETIRLWWKDIVNGVFMLYAPRDVLLKRKPRVRPEFIDAYLSAMDELPDLYRYISRGSHVPLTVFTVDASNDNYTATTEHILRTMGTWLTAVHAS